MNRWRTLPRLLAVALPLILVTSTFAARAEPAATDEAKRHFTNGVHLFEDRNFTGALVEFDASFQQNPTAAALQNIAVCQKALFRYADAIATLERMLRELGARLSADDKRAAEDAIREMSALLGTMVVKVTPPDAKVSINDAPLSAEAMKIPLRLSAGEYRVAAEAPGYARQEKVVTVVSGQNDRVVGIVLAPLSGAHAGPVDESTTLSTPVPSETPSQRGIYGFLALGADTMGSANPQGLNQAKPRSAGGFGGLVVGYRFSTAFGAELHAESSNHEVAACPAVPGRAGCSSTFGTATYSIRSSRIGPAARLMTSGRKSRLVGTVGLGAAVHAIAYDAALTTFSKKDVSAVGSYLSLALACELNLGHFLLDGGFALVGETLDESKTGIKNAGSFGLELRIGYGQW